MKELDQLKTYLLSNSSEDAKRQFVYPLFQKLFKKSFKTESDAEGADGYIEGKLLIELKSRNEDWLSGFYQGLHYLKKGISFPNICVISNKFIGLWKINAIHDDIKKIADESDPLRAPNEIGKINANKTNNFLKQKLFDSNVFLLTKTDFDGLFSKSINIELAAFLNALKNLDSARIQINPRNFIDCIDIMKKYFDDPLDAIHCFYSIVGSWDATSKVAINEERNELSVIGLKGERLSETIKMHPQRQKDFKSYIENRYIFTNEGSGLTVDYYFSRFDEVITRLKPEYAREHGIFFTDHNLSKFALWFVRHYYERKLSDNYIVFDPAGGSGNLVTSWHGHLKHKIVSELEPDLLKTIERRMKLDDYHVGNFTVIPKTVENKGLNFLNISAEDYVKELDKVLNEKNLRLDKPIAFLLNPPYKNTDENEKFLIEHDADYQIHSDILDVTGTDAGRERYLAFLGQILNIAKYQYSVNKTKSLLMIFTPTSWLIPRPTFKEFRKEFDKYFKYEKGFIIKSNEFFKIKGKWPLAFTIWSFDIDLERTNKIKVNDYTYILKNDLEINWNALLKTINSQGKSLINQANVINLTAKRNDIRQSLPKIYNTNSRKKKIQPRYDYSHAKRAEDYDRLVSGFPLRDEHNHYQIKRKCGITSGGFIGFMDDNTPVRVAQDTCCRMTNLPDRIWFRLDNVFININQTKIFNGPADNRSFCAYDLNSAFVTLSWFAMTKAFVGKYPLWANQFNLWKPKIKKEIEKDFYSLCFAFGLAENRCVVTKFEKDNPVVGATEVFVDNPLSTNNTDSFWNTTLDFYISKRSKEACELVSSVKKLYSIWLKEYCPTGNLTNVGLKNEPYFKYFDYDDFLTKDSGLIQIRKYAEINNKQDLLELFAIISANIKKVKIKIYKLLVDEFKYFD